MSPQPAPALPVGAQLGPYRIVRQIGEGGMGAVYEARQEPLDRRVALKTLHPHHASDKEAVARFFNEAKVLSRLEHPSIVQVSDFGQIPDGTAYLVMEYLRGESLARRFRTLFARGERLPTAAALQLAWQVADVLAIAHGQGIVHRDIKPENLMLVADPIAPGGERVKLLDFGIAKLTDVRDSGGLKTDTHAVMGTPLYMSPEQCEGAGRVDAKTDIYSLGCVLYEALAGRPPFLAEGSGQLIGMHLFREPQPLARLAPKVPSAVTELVHRMLTKEKQNRPSMSQTADELGRLLSKVTGGGAVTRSRAPATTDPDATHVPIAPGVSTTLGTSIGQSTESRRRRIRFIGIGAGGLALVGLAIVLLVRGAEPPKPRPVQPAAVPEPPIERPAPPARTIRWSIETQPAGASVLDEDGKQLGVTPWKSEQLLATGSTALRLRKDGYADATITLDRDQDVARQLALIRKPSMLRKPDAATPAKVTRPPPPPPPPKPPRRVGYED